VSRLRRLDVRLFASYALVVGVVVVALGITVGVRATSSFDENVRSAGERGQTEAESHNAFVDALWSTLPIALVVSAGTAGLAAVFVARKILRPISEVRAATRRLAAGHYDERVAPPAELELAALAGDVNLLAGELETTERRRAQLISEVAHEMRTPLTTIRGYAEGALDGVFEPDEELLTAVVEETARLERFAADLATLSRAEEHTLPLEITTEDLGELAASAATRLRPQFDDKGVTLDLGVAPPLPVAVDRDRILQVITNLLGNALVYTPAGGQVVVAAERREPCAVLTVADTGVGIAPQDLELIFERFYRVPGLPRPSGGSGIGLTIARGIARAHEGDIEAASAGPGEGATLTLALPLPSVERAASTEASEPASRLRRTRGATP
jgi:signal transduction histidine kinase